MVVYEIYGASVLGFVKPGESHSFALSCFNVNRLDVMSDAGCVIGLATGTYFAEKVHGFPWRSGSVREMVFNDGFKWVMGGSFVGYFFGRPLVIIAYVLVGVLVYRKFVLLS